MATIKKYLEVILEGKDLTIEQAEGLLDTIFEGAVPETQIAAFLAMMRMKNATPAEMAGLAKSLREHAVPLKIPADNLIDTCGTGGTAIKTFNVSTTVALVAAGAGAHVAKHGNRAITSKCGSADVLSKLGVKIDAPPDIVAECIEKARIGFMFAPMFHPAMRLVQPIRKSLDFQTAFNILGPLANPAGVTAQLMGVYDESLLDKICETLQLLGAERAMVVHSDGMDEISTIGTTRIRVLRQGEIRKMELHPTQVGIKAASGDELKGGDAAANAAITREILTGKDAGPKMDIVLLNAAAALMVADLADNFETGIKMARESINDGKAADCLEKLIEISNA